MCPSSARVFVHEYFACGNCRAILCVLPQEPSAFVFEAGPLTDLELAQYLGWLGGNPQACSKNHLQY